jgi:hypothetical protein
MAQIQQTQRRVDPELLHAAQHNPMLAYMIKNGLPLTRQTWIDLNWGGDTPKPWTAEDEAELPEPWQRVERG